MKTRSAQRGLAVRSWMDSIVLAVPYGRHDMLVGRCDSKAGRLAQRIDRAWANGLGAPDHPPADLERMRTETPPDIAMVVIAERLSELSELSVPGPPR